MGYILNEQMGYILNEQTSNHFVCRSGNQKQINKVALRQVILKANKLFNKLLYMQNCN